MLKINVSAAIYKKRATHYFFTEIVRKIALIPFDLEEGHGYSAFFQAGMAPNFGASGVLFRAEER